MKLYSNGLVYADNALIGIHKETITDLLTLTDERGTYAPFTASNMPESFRPFTQELYFRFAEWCALQGGDFYPGVPGIEPHWTIKEESRYRLKSTEEMFHIFIKEVND